MTSPYNQSRTSNLFVQHPFVRENGVQNTPRLSAGTQWVMNVPLPDVLRCTSLLLLLTCCSC